MPIPIAAAAGIAKAAPLIGKAVASATPMAAAGLAKAAPTLANVASKARLPALASWIDALRKSGALSNMNYNAAKNAFHISYQKLKKHFGNAGAGAGAAAAAKNGAMRLSKDSVGSALDSIISANGLPYLGMGNSKRFMDKAMETFLTSYLPQALTQGELDDMGIGQLLLPFAGAGGGGGKPPGKPPTFSAFANAYLDDDSGGVDWEALLDYYLNDGQDEAAAQQAGDGYVPDFVLGDGGPTVSGPFGNGPSGSGTGGELARVFGYGGQPGGGWSAEDLLNGASWSGQLEPAEQVVADPFAEMDAEMDWRRKQQKKQAKLERELQKKNQKWIEKRMNKYYRKKPSQWAKEKGFEAAGVLASTLGQGMNAYNSILANALMQAAASSVTRAQAEKYGNPLLAGTQLYAGGRMAGGQIANVIGQNVGNFLKNWGQDIAGEFERMRGLRIQMDVNPSGRAMDAIFKLGRYYGRNTHPEGRGYV